MPASAPIPALFRDFVFGAPLARTLDALYALYVARQGALDQGIDWRLFSKPRGDSIHEADWLTRHYFLMPNDLLVAVREGRVSGARDALGFHDDDAAAFMAAVRADLRAAYASMF